MTASAPLPYRKRVVVSSTPLNWLHLTCSAWPSALGCRVSAFGIANARRRRRHRRRSPGACRGCCRTADISAVMAATPPHDAIPVRTAVVRRRAQAGDGVALAADVVGGDVLDVVDRDLRRDVSMDLDERRESARHRSDWRTLPTSCASMAARSDWNHSKLSLRDQPGHASTRPHKSRQIQTKLSSQGCRPRSARTRPSRVESASPS